MEKRIFILALIVIFCMITNQHILGQISEGGTPLSFTLDIDAKKETIPVSVMPAVDVKALIAEEERSRIKNTPLGVGSLPTTN